MEIERGKRSQLKFIGDDGLLEDSPEKKSKWQMELFVDFDVYKSEYKLYVIDNDKKVFIPYIHKYSVGLYDVVLDICKEFSITIIGLYGTKGYMRDLYQNLLLSNCYVYDRDDIYQWRMKLDESTKRMTRPDYYYYAHGYVPTSETDYKMN